MSARHGRAAAVAFCLLLAASLAVGLMLQPPATPAISLVGEAVQLALCAAAAAILCTRGGVALFRRPTPTRMGAVCVALCMLVALNNLPWLALYSGAARITSGGGEILLFLLVCLLTATFEELFFRGYLFPLCLARTGKGAWGRLLAVLLSAAAFGLAHLFNLAAGAPLPQTLLQVGYSFLVGGAAAILLLHTRNLVVPILFHAVYNFGGLLIPRLGEGQIFDFPTVILTATLAVVSTVCLVASLFWGKKEDFLTPVGQEKIGKIERI